MPTTLYGFGPLFDLPSPSPYVMKAEIHLQMLGVDYACAFADLESVSKHKAPYVDDDGEIIQDSTFIRLHFENKLSKKLDAGLSDQHKATGHALERMAEDHLAKTMLMARWLDDDNFNKGPAVFFMAVPEEARQKVIDEARGAIKTGLYDAGFGRHSEDERMLLAGRDMDAIAGQLGDKPYLFGDQPSVADGAVSGVLSSCATPFFKTPLVGMVKARDNLPAYLARINKRFFADSAKKWPVPAAM